MKVTPAQIRAALETCEGNVARASLILGIARNNLYKRLSDLDLNPDTFRAERGNTGASAHVTADAHSAASVRGATPREALRAAAGAPQSSMPSRRAGDAGRILHAVNSPAPALKAEPAAEETKRLRQSRSFYFRPDHIKTIEEACLDLPAILREPMSPSKVLERFMDDALAPWLDRMKKVPAKRRAAKKDDER